MRLAVLIPTFNRSAKVRQAIDSVRASRLCTQNKVLMYLADDASPDDTIHVAREAWGNEDSFRLIAASKNRGECQNVNAAMSQIARDGINWAVLLHDDDLLRSGWLDKVSEVAMAASGRMGMICCRSIYSDDDSILAEDSDITDEVVLHSGGMATIEGLRDRWFWTVSGSAMYVPAFQAIGGFHPMLNYAADNDFLVRLFLAGFAVEEHSYPGITKRGHEASSTSRTVREGVDMRDWSYLMLAYVQLRGRAKTSQEFATALFKVIRRTISPTLIKSGPGVWKGQLRAASILLRSWCALVSRTDAFIPRSVRDRLAAMPKYSPGS